MGNAAKRWVFALGPAAARSAIRSSLALTLLAIAAAAWAAPLLPNPNPAGNEIVIPFTSPPVTDVFNSGPFENLGTIIIRRTFVGSDYLSGTLTNTDPNTVLLNRGAIGIFTGGRLVNTAEATLVNRSTPGIQASIQVDGFLANTLGATLTNESGSAIAGLGDLSNQALFTNTGRGAYFNIDGTLTNTGAGATLTNAAGALLDAGAIQNLGGATLTNTGVFGAGDLRDLSQLMTKGLLINSGSGTQLVNQGFASLTNGYNYFTNLPTSILNQDGASLVNTDGAMLSNEAGAHFTNTGLGTQLTNQGAYITNTDSGTSLVNEDRARFTNTGGQLWNREGAFITNSSGAELTNQAGSSLLNDGATISNISGATLTNTGAGTTLSNENNATLRNWVGGTLINEQGATLRNSASLVNDGSIRNSATIELTNTGSVSGAGSYAQTAGILAVDGTMTQSVLNFAGGVVCGTGTINGSPVSANTRWRPGTCSPLGTLGINGDFLFDSGVLEIDVVGLGPGEFGALTVTGAAIFMGGTIELNFLNGFVPHEGDTIAFLLAGSIQGLDRLIFDSNGLPPGSDFDVRLGPDGHVAFVMGATAVPEPPTSALVFVGLAALLHFRRATKGQRRCGMVRGSLG